MNRKATILTALLVALTAMVPVLAMANGSAEEKEGSPSAPPPMMAMSADSGELQRAVLAGGCFWGVEAVFEALAGVSDVRSGYSGGDASTADYYTVASGTTGHAESVEITYDPSVISYGTLLEVFFTVAHDPTQLNYQGPDHGTQYRSAIFYSTDNQRTIGESYIEQLEQSGMYADPIVTQVVPLERFYPAEEYHQDFIQNNPDYPYVVYWDIPKLEHLEEAYPELLAQHN